MKTIPLKLTPRRREVLWHAAYSIAEWSATEFRGHHKPVLKIQLGGMDVSQIVLLLRKFRLVRIDAAPGVRGRVWCNVTITPRGMDVLLGNVECKE